MFGYFGVLKPSKSNIMMTKGAFKIRSRNEFLQFVKLNAFVNILRHIHEEDKIYFLPN